MMRFGSYQLHFQGLAIHHTHPEDLLNRLPGNRPRLRAGHSDRQGPQGSGQGRSPTVSVRAHPHADIPRETDLPRSDL